MKILNGGEQSEGVQNAEIFEVSDFAWRLLEASLRNGPRMQATNSCLYFASQLLALAGHNLGGTSRRADASSFILLAEDLRKKSEVPLDL